MSGSRLKFLAVIVTALALVPAGAHLLEMPSKLALSRDDYLTVQGIYRGWALLGVLPIAAVVADLALALALRRDRAAAGLALLGGLLMAGALGVFFVWVFPANQATDDWTTLPEPWEALRAQWEYGHAAGAIATLLALCAVVAASLRRGG